MIKEIIATGRDVYEALDSGCLLLGVNREDAQFEIIDLPKKTFLGLKKLPARVRVYIEVPDAPQPKRPAQPVQNKPVQKQPAETRPAPAQAAAAPEAQPAPVSGDAPAVPAEGGNKHKRDRHRKRADGEAPVTAEDRRDEAPRQEIEPTEEVRDKAEKARVYVTDILHAMGFSELEIKPCFYEENVRLQLGGERLGSVIGRRGETLDALQYLASLVANRGEGDYLRINIDSGNYREKRERTLEALARKLAGNALRSGRSITLEPMNPYERRIIHGTVSEMKGVSSSSIGVEPNRRVVITPDGTVPPTESGERTGDRTDRGGRPRHSRGGRVGRPGGGRGERSGERTERTERTGDRTDRGGRGPGHGGRRDDPPAIGGPVRHESAAARPEKSIEEKALTETASLYGKIEL